MGTRYSLLQPGSEYHHPQMTRDVTFKRLGRFERKAPKLSPISEFGELKKCWYDYKHLGDFIQPGTAWVD